MTIFDFPKLLLRLVLLAAFGVAVPSIHGGGVAARASRASAVA